MRTLATTAVLLLSFASERAEAQPDSQPVPLPSPEPSAEPAPAKTPTGGTCKLSLDVHVVDKKTHEPIAGAIVSVDVDTNAITDETGHSIVDLLCPGPHVVEASRIDYEAGKKTVTLTRSGNLEVELVNAAGEEVIVIEGTRADTEMRSSTEITGAALERTRGRSLADALSDVPGVRELGSASGLAKPIVRGQFGRRLLLLVDGVRHRAQEWGLDHAPEIDPFTADSLTVVRGASGVRYGSDAIGGAILVKPPALRRDSGTTGEAHLVGISNGRGGSASARIQTVPRLVPDSSLQLEGSFKRLSGQQTPNYALDNTGVMEWSVGGAAGYRLRDAEFSLSYRHYQAQLGVCRCLQIESSDDFFAQLEREEPIGAELFDDDFEIERPYQSVAHDLAIARATFRPDSLGTITATYAVQWDHRREFAVVRDPTGAQFDFRLWTHDLEATLRHKPIHVGDHVHLRGTAGLAGLAQFHNFSGLPLVPDHRAFGGGVFASERLLGHNFELEAGVRYDYLNRAADIERRDFLRLVRSDQLEDDACGDMTVDPVRCSSSFNTISASLGGLVDLTDGLAIKLDLSTASRAPNPDEQYLNGTSPTLPVLGLGKPDLGPETTYSGTATAIYQSDRLSAEVSGYGNLITDYIYFAPAVDEDGMPIFDVLIRGSFPRFITTPVDALFYGFDGGLTARPLPWIELGAQASIVRGRNRSSDSALSFVPPDRFRGVAGVRELAFSGLSGIFAQAAGTYVARQTRFDITADLAPPPDGYFLLDAELGAEKAVGEQTYKFAVRGSNLLNKRYRDYTSLLRYFADQPGWQISLRLSASFSEL